MKLPDDQERLKGLLQETITLLCKNGLNYKAEFSVEALIVVTLDQEQMFHANIKETVAKEGSNISLELEDHSRSASKRNSKKRRCGEDGLEVPKKRNSQQNRRAEDSHEVYDESVKFDEETSSESVVIKDEQKMKSPPVPLRDLEYVDQSGEHFSQQPQGVWSAASPYSADDASRAQSQEINEFDDDEFDNVHEVGVQKVILSEKWPKSRRLSNKSSFRKAKLSTIFKKRSNIANIEHTGSEDAQVFKCNDCSFMSKWSNSIKRHVREKHMLERYQCHLCGANFAGRSTLKDHIQYSHKNPLCCSTCGKSFKSKEGLLGHEKQHRGEGNYKCNICSKVFINKSHFEGHENSHLNSKPFTCVKCSKGYGYKSSLIEHMKTCIGPSVKPTVYPCPEGSCGEVFRNKNSMKEHINAKHRSTIFICQKCGRDFEWRQSYYRHKKNCKVKEDQNSSKTLQNTENIDQPLIKSSNKNHLLIPIDSKEEADDELKSMSNLSLDVS